MKSLMTEIEHDGLVIHIRPTPSDPDASYRVVRMSVRQRFESHAHAVEWGLLEHVRLDIAGKNIWSQRLEPTDREEP